MRLAEKHALNNSGERIYVSDLCAAAHVSERTLQTAFHETVGMSPISFLNRLRLHGAPGALGDASRGPTTVSSVALDWGFWHFGDFSRAYRDCFGETPSATLRQV